MASAPPGVNHPAELSVARESVTPDLEEESLWDDLLQADNLCGILHGAELALVLLHEGFKSKSNRRTPSHQRVLREVCYISND